MMLPVIWFYLFTEPSSACRFPTIKRDGLVADIKASYV